MQPGVREGAGAYPYTPAATRMASITSEIAVCIMLDDENVSRNQNLTLAICGPTCQAVRLAFEHNARISKISGNCTAKRAGPLCNRWTVLILGVSSTRSQNFNRFCSAAELQSEEEPTISGFEGAPGATLVLYFSSHTNYRCGPISVSRKQGIGDIVFNLLLKELDVFLLHCIMIFSVASFTDKTIK